MIWYFFEISYEDKHKEPEGRGVLGVDRPQPDGTSPPIQIADLKEKIREEKGHAVDSQKIIFKGKTTTNDEKIEKLALK